MRHKAQNPHAPTTSERTPYKLPKKETSPYILAGMFRRAQSAARDGNRKFVFAD